MGYQTHYSLSVSYEGSDKENYFEETEKVIDAEIDGGYGTIGELIKGGLEAKWYDHDKDMRRISTQFPKILFILEGHGEEHDDIWKAYYFNGKCQRCKAVLRFPSFDATQLK